ncbi:general stress protein [Bacillus sp. EB600]|uniref:general stress protein n=1 Tax=Bacillus sp. EB600 TaxID=2806345 RepID=UPI00210E4458|nr:general stress protein [Bacillus sp. EB600]MCQ6282615.1 general stress protein [Bacillus sp. EB600]
MKQVKVVENGVEAKKVIDQFLNQGVSKEDVYVLAHDEDRSEDLTDALGANNIGVQEQGFMDTFTNVFRTRGEELRSKLESLGLSNQEAEHLEEELDQGRIVVVAS